ncbi:unnamed protein product [Pleuronectes platessa]|uniref:Uncharacterized protein n=1 Tax=Pleuronectes platessa TaxID=8262 RepID=A0A9N7UVB8_PLEPL|nr:unnamed protein product [Pleuronectes platessa]
MGARDERPVTDAEDQGLLSGCQPHLSTFTSPPSTAEGEREGDAERDGVLVVVVVVARYPYKTGGICLSRLQQSQINKSVCTQPDRIHIPGAHTCGEREHKPRGLTCGLRRCQREGLKGGGDDFWSD